MLEIDELTPDDWRLWRRLRQAALAEAPQAFGSTLAEWSGAGDTEARWRARLADVALNISVSSDGEPVAMASGTAPGSRGAVEIISMWVAPAARGAGVGDAAIRHIIGWAARAYPNAGLELSVKADNPVAIALYQRHGFIDAGPSPDDPGERLMRYPG
jgi:ribosomal protein S18 acetylase RimI-like enzyme